MTAGTGTARGLRGLLGPRHAGHTMTADHLGALSLPVGDDGVVIGDDAEGRPQMLGFHRSAPYDVLLIGGLWTAQVLALRAAGTGARVAVETGRAQAWTLLAQAAGAGLECITLHDVGRVPPMGATVGSPVVVVRDCGMRPPRGRVVSSPWQSVLTLLPYLSPVAPRLMRDSTLVGIQRVSPQEAEQIGRILALSQAEIEALPTLADGVTLWCAGRERHWVMTSATDAESGLLGVARRMD
jgi:ESX secretion system protein EccE